MNITFNNIGNEYYSEFTVEQDFNVHIEFDYSTPLKFYQKSIDNGDYAEIKGLKITNNKVVDYDFIGAIYPKYIKIVSEVEPTLAIVTFVQ